jgi:hypothetical protein
MQTTLVSPQLIKHRKDHDIHMYGIENASPDLGPALSLAGFNQLMGSQPFQW